MSLHITQQGHGPDLVLLHGWGFNSAIWSPITHELSKSFRLHLVDLPGHGHSPALGIEHDAIRLAACIAEYTPENAHYLGWSMGGSIAMNLALQQAERINKLVLVASTPRFINNATWHNGVAEQIFQQFGHDLKQNYAATIKRFLTLQSLGNPSQRHQFKQLQNLLMQAPQPSSATLQSGLQLLQENDLTLQCQSIKHNCLLIHSNDDKLVPLAAAHYLADKLAHSQLTVIENTGHTAFINQADAFCQHVRSFLYDAK